MFTSVLSHRPLHQNLMCLSHLLRQQMESWRTAAPLCWPNCCPAAQCQSQVTAAAPRGRGSLHPQSGMYHFPKTASVSERVEPSRVRRTLTDQPCNVRLSPVLHTEADSLQQISLQTLNADPFLKRSVTARTCSPPPTSPSLLSRGTYSSVLNSSRYPLAQIHSNFTNFTYFLPMVVHYQKKLSAG